MKVLVVSSDTKSLIDFRGDLMSEFINKGHEVVAVAPELEFEDEFKELGVEFSQIAFDRASTNPFNDIKFYKDIKKIIKSENPDLIFSYAIKPVIYASIAAKRCGVKNIYSLLPGLGFTFNKSDKKSVKENLINKTVIQLLRYSCKFNKVVMVQNPDDREELIQNKIVKVDQCVRVNSSGVNMNRFMPTEFAEKIVFIMISRLLKDKGILEYIQAASILKKKYSNVDFQLLGPFDSNPMAIKKEELGELICDGCVEYLGTTNDVRPYLAGSSVFVLPSYYREGVPRSIQEAMAMGRAIITTDWIGCRETVIDRFNGYLVEPQNVDDLTKKMECFILNPEQIFSMGENSLKYCEEKFDVKIVNKQMLETMKIIKS